MFSTESLTKYYGEQCGLKDLSLSLEAGDVLGVLGHNGSGKTTLFRLLLGLIPPSSGRIHFKSTAPLSQMIGYLPEERALYPDIGLKDQIRYFARLKKLDPPTIDDRLDYWLTYFHLKDYGNRPVQKLSKGNKQKVQFICALIHNPSILILDEPLTGLDAVNVSLFKQVICHQSQRGVTILLSSHQYEELEQFCSDILLLKKGERVLSGKLTDLKKQDPRRCITINKEAQVHLVDPDLKMERIGNYVRYSVFSVRMQNVLMQSLNQQPLDYYKYEQVSLRDIIEEAS